MSFRTYRRDVNPFETSTKGTLFEADISIALNFLVAVVNSFNTKTHSSKEMTEFCFENAHDKSICCCKERVKSTLSLFSRMCRTEALKAVHIFHLTPTQLVWNGVA